MPYRIPVGPYHPALEEPYKLSVSCLGETIERVDVEIGFSFRAIELLAQKRNYMQGLTLVERVCGICSHVHGMTFCMAVEALAGIGVPARARFIRVVLAELERLHSHLLWLGIAAEEIGFKTMFLETFALRERVMDVLERISGNRVHYAMSAFGGASRDLTDPDDLRSAVRELRRGVERDLLPVFLENRTARARTAGVGPLSRRDALAHGTVGPTARASGVNLDVRRDAPYAAYAELQVQVVMENDGDVRARLVVRAREMLESLRLIEQALRDLPVGPIRAEPGFPRVPAGEITVRAEAPRGELFYYVRSDGGDTPRRVKIRTPSFMNIPAIHCMSVGQQLADLPLIQASVDPCCSCTDR
jgi:Ni,Fe-hydrogenase III large subunit